MLAPRVRSFPRFGLFWIQVLDLVLLGCAVKGQQNPSAPIADYMAPEIMMLNGGGQASAAPPPYDGEPGALVI